MSKDRTRIHLTAQELSVIERTVAVTSEILDKIMSEQSAKEYAIMLCKPHRQSTKSIASTSLLFNIVDGNQELPASSDVSIFSSEILISWWLFTSLFS